MLYIVMISHSFLAIFPLLVMEQFFHSFFRQACFEKKKKLAYMLLVFFIQLPYMLILYPLNTCKLDLEETILLSI